MAFPNAMFSTKISDLTKDLTQCLQVNVAKSVLLLTDLTRGAKFLDLTKMTFSNSTRLEMIKTSTVSGIQEVIKNDFSQLNLLKNGEVGYYPFSKDFSSF